MFNIKVKNTISFILDKSNDSKTKSTFEAYKLTIII